MRILVADDQALIRDMLSRMLGMDHRVDTAVDGLAAWDAVCMADDDGKPYDLVITDHEMPHITGTELAVRIRNAGFTPRIVICSGVASEIDCAAADAILSKPFSFRYLEEEIKLAAT